MSCSLAFEKLPGGKEKGVEGTVGAGKKKSWGGIGGHREGRVEIQRDEAMAWRVPSS